MANPAALYGNVTDAPTATRAGSATGNGIAIGQEYYDESLGKRYRYVQASATIATGFACKTDSSQSNPNVVLPTAAVGDPFDGVNETGSSATTALPYFWMTIEGPVSVKVAASTNAGVIVAPSNASGILGAGAAGSVELLRCSVVTGTGGSAAITACRLY